MAKSLEDARKIIMDNIAPLETVSVDLLELVGRSSAEEIRAPWDLPRWDNSEMDGFAVASSDCQLPTSLQVVGYLPAGVSAENVAVKPGTAVRIMTGAPVPAGCGAIVPIENTDVGDDSVTIVKTVQPGEYIRARGSDIAAGELMIPLGTVLRPADINLLAAFGRVEMRVYRQPRVAILSTGDELVAPGEIAGPGQIIDTNAYSLAAAVKQLGGVPQLLGIARDDYASLRQKIILGLQADALITSAGISTGDRDLVSEILSEVGVQQLFWRVAIKPSGPTAFGIQAGKPVFSLPGNPVSSMIGFEELVRPALLKMMGQKVLFRPLRKATAKTTLLNTSGKLRFLRVKAMETDEGLVVESAGNQNTGVLSTMIRANAFAILPADRGKVDCGETVEVQFF
jgi:molybdopterin molybdotransferase